VNVELSSEDSLRLNVLIANAEAVRIDENALIVYGLNGEREMKVQLNPNCRSDKYLMAVREMLSAAVLDSPGGYPVFLRRWTRMGQIDSDQLDRLLKLGEPEAVMAVVCSPGLTDELARLAWWSAPYAEHARRMLENRRVVAGIMGKVLAEYLIDHLPFETEHGDMLNTVRLVLQPGLITEQQRKRLWESGRSKATYRVGFLAIDPENLLEPVEPRWDFAKHQAALQPLVEAGNPYAVMLYKLLDSPGQTFAAVVVEAMRRPADQEVVSALFNAIGRYFSPLGCPQRGWRDMEGISSQVSAILEKPNQELQALLDAVPDLRDDIRAMLLLGHLDESPLIPIFALTDAVGSVMRKKIEPVTSPMLEQFAQLRGLRR
jgi:hypothetical protein